MLDKLGLNTGVAIICLIIFLIVLICLSYVIKLQKVIIEKLDLKEKKTESRASIDSSLNFTEAPSDDDELVAVIAAALAAYLDKPVSNIKVRSIKKMGAHVSSWAAAGRQEQMNTRF